MAVPTEGGGNQGEPAFDSLAAAFRLALELLLRHKWYHHQVELLASHLEDISDALCYEQYHRNAYQKTFADEACIEESLANAYVYRSRACSRRAPNRTIFRALFDKAAQNQPTAYQNYHRYRGEDFQLGGQYLGNIVQTANPGAAPLGITNPDRRLALGANLPFTTGVHQPRDHQRVPLYIVRTPYRLPSLSAFRAIQLETNYELVRSDTWAKKYDTVDTTLRQLVDTTEAKLERNANLPGFQWRRCPRGYEYGRMNDQYRMIVDKDERAERIELVDFGGHGLPQTDYSCY